MTQYTVYALCAQWCGTCREFRAAWDAAVVQPDRRFVWIDVEDDADRLDDLDVETFPTIAVLRDDAPHFFGPVLPSIAAVERLLHPDVGAQHVATRDRARIEQLHASFCASASP
jgi:hypothetical protein